MGLAQGLPGFLRELLRRASSLLFPGTAWCQRSSANATASRLAPCSGATCHPTGFQNLEEPLDHFPGEACRVSTGQAGRNARAPGCSSAPRSQASPRASAGRVLPAAGRRNWALPIRASGQGELPATFCHPHLWTPPPPPGTPIPSTACQNSPRPSGTTPSAASPVRLCLRAPQGQCPSVPWPES